MLFCLKANAKPAPPVPIGNALGALSNRGTRLVAAIRGSYGKIVSRGTSHASSGKRLQFCIDIGGGAIQNCVFRVHVIKKL